MATTHRAPKQWPLTKTETVNSFESWKHNLQYILSLDPHFTPFLANEFKWDKKTKAAPLRGFTNDGEDVVEALRMTAINKNAALELMLGQIANYCPVISRRTITGNCTSLNEVWQVIRLHYGFQVTGAHFLDFNNMTLQAENKGLH